MTRIAAAVSGAVATIACLLVLGCTNGPVRSEKAELQKGSNSVSTSLAPSSERQLSTDAAFTVISDNNKFAICRVRQLKAKEFPSGGGGLPTPRYLSEAEDAGVLEFLAQHGYVRMQRTQEPTYYTHVPCPGSLADSVSRVPGAYYQGNGITCGDVPGGYVPAAAIWEPTAKAKAAMGHVIRQHESAAPVKLQRMLAIKRVISWDVILGCRELIKVDGLTPLSDSTKVDFSWRWVPTELGRAAGLSNSLERGEAYLRREGNGWTVENLYSKEPSK